MEILRLLALGAAIVAGFLSVAGALGVALAFADPGAIQWAVGLLVAATVLEVLRAAFRSRP